MIEALIFVGALYFACVAITAYHLLDKRPWRATPRYPRSVVFWGVLVNLVLAPVVVGLVIREGLK